MEGVGDLNCSHTSLTSPDTLAALRELPKTNPRLHRELLGVDETSPPLVDNSDPEEEPFADEVEDDSDIPIATVASHMASGRLDVGEGFEVLGDGGIGRVGLAEETDVEMENISGEGGGAMELEEKEEKKGRGCCKKISRVPFNGIGAWDCD